MGDYYDEDKFSTFINPSDVYDLIDSIDINKVRNDLGTNVCIRPSNIDNESIEFYMTWQIPERIGNLAYMNEIKKMLDPHLSIEKKSNEAYISVKI